MESKRTQPAEEVQSKAVEYRVLGQLRVEADGRNLKLGGPRQRMVLAVLLSQANRTMRQDALIEAVWGGQPPEAARATLQGYVYGLRRELGAEAIVRDGDGYRVQVDDANLDSLRFERLVDDGRRRLEGHSEQARAALDEALGLWYGSPYGDLGAESALAAEVGRLEDLRLVAVEHRIEADLVLGNHGRVIAELETLVRDHPYREKLHGMLMLSLYRSGRQAEALRTYQRARTLLADELGIDPSPDLRTLEQRILEQDPGLEAHARTERSAVTAQPAHMVRGYELRERIGEGDYGVVHRAFQPSVGRELGVKIIRPDYVNNAWFVQRFEAEAKRVAQLEHPHIVSLNDYWRDPEGAYLVMPLLRGGSLSETLRRGPWNLAPALRMLDQVGSAIGYAHRQGVIHRDIKPSNILLDEDGNAYVADFAIATRLADDVGAPMTTSLAYVAPEEARGEPLSPRSDIFSLGVLTFEVLTGVRPTMAPLPALSDARPGLPAGLDEVLRRATDDQPANRYDRVENFLRALRRAVGADVVAVGETAEPLPQTLPARNPYKGLRAFAETDVLDFHGREALIDALLRAVATHTVVTVVGPSGSGKSSVVRAGLIPALRAGGLPGSRAWLLADMFPGSYPFEELEAALLRVATVRTAALIDELNADDRGLLRASKQILPPDSELVLIVDQFEELFSSVGSEEVRQRFLDNLVTVARDERSRVRVVLTMRADFFDRPLEYPEFGTILRDGLVTVTPPSEEGLAQAVAAPARGVGVDLEPGLVGRIISDVKSQPGALPLLQYALTELFNRRDGSLLTIAGYDATGGVVGALRRRAEELYDQLTPPGQEAARQLFLRLVNVEEGASDTRRRVRQTELKTLAVDQKALDQVLQQFGSFRLLSFDRDPVTRSPTVEVAHEALLGEWTLLRDWIDAVREDLAFYRRLTNAAREWADAGTDPSFLLRGGRLEQADRWAGRGGIALSEEEKAYLEASRAMRAAETAAAQRRRRLAVVSVLVVITVLATLAGLALWQRQVATEQARQTDVRRLANASALALGEDPELAILLGLHAVTLSQQAGETPLAEAVAALHHAVQTSRLELRLAGGHRDVAMSSDGALLITDGPGGESGAAANEVIVWDATDGSQIRTLAGDGPVAGLALSPDDRLLAVGYRDPSTTASSVVSWDLATGDEVQGFSGGTPVAWSPDGRLLATVVSAVPDNPAAPVRMTVRDVRTDQVTASFDVPGGWLDAAFLDTSTLLVGDPARSVVGFYDTSSGQRRSALHTPGFVPQTLTIDRARNRLVAGSVQSRAVQVWDLESRTRIWSSPVPDGQVVAYSDATGVVASAGNDGQVRLHNAGNGSVVTTLDGHTGAVSAATFYPDGDRLASVGLDGETRVWSVTDAGAADVGAIDFGSGEPFAVSTSPDGREAAVAAAGSLQRFDLRTGELLGVVEGDISVFSPAPVSPDWRWVASVDASGEASVRDLETGAQQWPLPECAEPRAFSPDGSLLVVDGVSRCDAAAAPQTAELRNRVIDVASGREVLDLGDRGPLAGPRSAVFNPAGTFAAGRYAVTVVSSSVVELHDIAARERLGTLELEGDIPLSIAFDPTGRYLAGGTQNGRAWVLDLLAVVDGTSPTDALAFSQVVATGGVGGVALNADGVLATSAFNLLRLWDIDSGELLSELDVEIRTPPIAAFSPEGDYLYYADMGVLRRFPLESGELVELAERRLTRDLTEEECRRFLDSGRCSPAS